MRDSGFGLRYIAIEGADADPALEAEIAELLRSQSGRFLYEIDLKGLTKSVDDLIWVDKVQIKRQLPDRLQVSVTPFTPSARWDFGGRRYVINEKGKIIRAISTEEFTWLPLYIGDLANARQSEMQTFLASSDFLSEHIIAAQLLGKRNWKLYLRDGSEIYLPKSNPKSVIMMMDRMQAQFGLLQMGACRYDFRENSRLVLGECSPPV